MVEECYPQTSTLYFSESSTIGNNSAAHSGGGIYVFNNTTFNFHEQLSQNQNGGGCFAQKNTLNFSGSGLLETTQLHLLVEKFFDTSTLSNFSIFRNISANNDGGGIHSSG